MPNNILVLEMLLCSWGKQSKSGRACSLINLPDDTEIIVFLFTSIRFLQFQGIIAAAGIALIYFGNQYVSLNVEK